MLLKAVVLVLIRVSWPCSFGYNDAGQPTSVGYLDNIYLCDSYDAASGWLSAVSVTAAGASSGCQTSGQTTLASGLAYGGDAGAAGLVTAATLTGVSGAPVYSASYDADLLAALPHIHFEVIASNGRWILENSHVYLI